MSEKQRFIENYPTKVLVESQYQSQKSHQQYDYTESDQIPNKIKNDGNSFVHKNQDKFVSTAKNVARLQRESQRVLKLKKSLDKRQRKLVKGNLAGKIQSTKN